MYDDSLRPLGLHATQFPILQALVQKQLRHKVGDARWRGLQKLSIAAIDAVGNSRREGVNRNYARLLLAILAMWYSNRCF